jgi:hypothetical protein
VPIAEHVNGMGIRAIKSADVATTRLTLLAILENLVLDEVESGDTSRRIPVTPLLAVAEQKIKTRRT